MKKKLIQFFTISLVIIAALGITVFVIVDKPLPAGTLGPEAEELADEMLKAINKEGYDTLSYIEFVFRNSHYHKWDKKNNAVVVKWEDQEIYLDLNRKMETFNLLELQAYEYFINDSFWVVAPYKVRDPGVIRSTVEVDNGRGLLITYSTGGLTPGDSYLWILDENGFPKAWKLWTSNIPVGGLEFSWDGWVIMNDVWFSNLHEGLFINVPVEVLSVR
ncbi:MAG: hypothetical protein RIM99_14870 [Cyclobacteriaceae bacterium]